MIVLSPRIEFVNNSEGSPLNSLLDLHQSIEFNLSISGLLPDLRPIVAISDLVQRPRMFPDLEQHASLEQKRLVNILPSRFCPHSRRNRYR